MKYDEILSKSSTKAEEAAEKVKKAEEELAQAQKAVESAGVGASEELPLIAEVSKMSAEEFVETWKNEPIQAIEAFIGGLGTLEERGMDVNGVLDTLSMDGVRQGNMLKSLSLATDVLTESVDRANQAYEENSALTNEAEERYKTTESQLAMVKEAFDNVKVAIGEGLQPTFNEFVELAKNGFLAIEEAYETGGVEGLFNELGTQFQNLVDLAMEKLPEFQSVVNEILPGLKDAASSIVDTIATEIITHIPDVLAAAGEILSSIGGYISNHAKDLLDVAHTLGQGFVDLINKAAEKISEVKWGEITQQMASFIATHFGTVSWNLVDTGVKFITALTGAVKDAAPGIGKSLGEIVLGLADAVFDPENVQKILQAAQDILGAILDAMAGAASVYEEKGPLITVKIGEAILFAFSELISAGEKVSDYILSGMLFGTDINKGIYGDELSKAINEEIDKHREELENAGWKIANFISGGMLDGLFSNAKNLEDITAEELQEYNNGAFNFDWSGLWDSIYDAAWDDFNNDLAAQGSSYFVSETPDFSSSSISSNSIETPAYVQNITINSPTELNASEISRQVKNQSQNFVLQSRVTY